MKFNKKSLKSGAMALIGSMLVVAGISVVFSTFGKNEMQNSSETFVQTVSVDGELTISSKALASFSPMLKAPYKSMDVYLSKEMKTEKPFTSVGASWEERSTEGASVEVQVRTMEDKKWSEWIDLAEEEDVKQDEVTGNFKRMYALFSSNPTQKLQYRFLMYGSKESAPIIRNQKWTFIHAGEMASYKVAPSPKYYSSPVKQLVTNVSLNGYKTNIITRKQWGANESYRYLTDNTQEPDLVELDPELIAPYKDELKFSRVVETDTKGKKYVWPLQYPEKVKKFIVHHTATTKNLNNPKQAIRDIYTIF